MKKIFSLLLLCILVFSITVSLTSCWWKNNSSQGSGNNGGDDVIDPTPDPDPNPEDETIDIDGGTTNNGIELPPVNIPSKNGQE